MLALLLAKKVYAAIGDGPQDDEITSKPSELIVVTPTPTPQPRVLDVNNLYLPTTKAVKLHLDDSRGYAGQCVGYVKYELRNIAPTMRGNAITWKRYITTKDPVVGSVVVFSGGRYGHVGIVIAVDEETITVRSRNYHGRYIISDDVFKRNYARILGYITF